VGHDEGVDRANRRIPAGCRRSGFVTEANFIVDGGMTRKMISVDWVAE
jgi:hypothetical protein